MKAYTRGFTLIEVMIALFIFTLLATITSGVLYRSLQTREHINQINKTLGDIQMSVNFLSQDITQMINRPIHAEGQRLPAFIGDTNTIEFTQSRMLNPHNLEKRSTLLRVAFICENRQLIRRIYQPLDTLKRVVISDMVLLTDIDTCQFAYLNHALQIIHSWSTAVPGFGNEDSDFPKAIQWSLGIKKWGTMTLLFPVYIYDKSV